MNDIELHAWATIALCAGPILFFRGFRDFRLHRLIQNTPTSRIRSMAMGLAEINGTVLQRSSVRAPFSNQPCAYWEVSIAIRVNQKHGWTTVYREASGQPFYVEDQTGVVLVYPKGSTCRVPPTAEEECLGATMPEIYSDFMAERRIRRRFLWGFSQMRFREHRVQEGEPVYILGSAEPRSQSRDVSLADLSDRPFAVASADADAQTLKATGTDGAHHHATARASNVASRPERLRSLHDRVVAVVRKGRNDPTFVISRDSEETLTLTLGLLTVVKLICGPLLTVFGLVYWLIALAPMAGAK
jgi:hypothetical protein